MLPEPTTAIGVSCPLLWPLLHAGTHGVQTPFPTQRRRTEGHDKAVHLSASCAIGIEPGQGISRKIYPAFTLFLGDRRPNGDVMFFSVEVNIAPEDLGDLTIIIVRSNPGEEFKDPGRQKCEIIE